MPVKGFRQWRNSFILYQKRTKYLMDKLLLCAHAYQKLLDYEYEMTIGSKDKLIKLTLFFESSHFLHLIGLHKLTDLQIQRTDKKNVIEKIINCEITYDNICKSAYFSEIAERIQFFILLERILDSNDLVIRYNKRKVKGTAVEASFVIVYEYENRKLHYFIDFDGEERLYGRTFFIRTGTDDKYIAGQQKYKVLKKIKVNKTMGEKIVLVDKIKVI